MRRRTFLQSVPTAALAASAASPRSIRLGYDTYSIRDFQWKAIEHLDYAARQKLDAIQLSGLGDYESLEPTHLARVKDHAARHGIVIDGGIGCICPTSKGWNPRNGDPAEYMVRGLSVCKAVGATAMRCFMGGTADRFGPIPIEQHMDTTIKVLRSVRSQALDTGVKIAVENHGDLQAGEVRTIIEEAGKDFVASCFDSGNSVFVLEDPLYTLETLAPYVVTTHIRDSVVYEHPRGAAAQWVALGDGSIDFRRFVARYAELCPQAPFQLEIITGRPPRVLPYLEADFWQAFPKATASGFARFVALAKAGHPFFGSMVIAGPEEQPAEIRAALKEQQRLDLERSFEYAGKTLDVGVRWRG